MPQLRLVKNIAPTFSSNPENLYAVGNTLFFAAEGDDRTDTELWASDCTALGTRLVKDLYPFPFLGSDPGGEESTSVDQSGKLAMAALNNRLYFRASSQSYGSEVFVSDGTDQGTKRLRMFNGTEVNDVAFNEHDAMITAVGNRVFFVADDGNTGRELWTSDGTRAGTRLVRDLYPGSESSDPRDFLVKGNELYVSATNQDDDRELYAYGDPLPNYTPRPS